MCGLLARTLTRGERPLLALLDHFHEVVRQVVTVNDRAAEMVATPGVVFSSNAVSAEFFLVSLDQELHI
jgi:hypothetical protein